MSWRPKDWEETLRGILDRFNVTYMNSDECRLIEAGADAMLEALKKGGCRFTRKPIRIDKYLSWMPAGKVNQKGWLVFIEEDHG